MSKNIDKFLMAAANAEKELRENWEQLKLKYEDLKKFLPGLPAPWAANQNIQLQGERGHYFSRGGINRMIMNLMPENPDDRIGYPEIRSGLKDSGYKDGYIYNAMNKMIVTGTAVDGFRIEKVQSDEETHPRFFKVRVNKQNA